MQPKDTYLLGAACLAKMRDRGSVPPIQSLLQELGCEIPLSGKHYGASVKLVIGFFVCSGQFHLDENLA